MYNDIKNLIKTEFNRAKVEFGIITPLIMLVLRLVQYLPPQCLLGNRTDFKIKHLEILGKDRIKLAKERAIKIDFMILFFLAIEVFYLIFNPLSSCLDKILLIVFLARLVDIFQVNLNLILFDQLRVPENRISKYTRSVVLLIINYIELILIFGFIYWYYNEDLIGSKDIYDAYYFSCITHFTIGYGDIKPTNFLRLIVAIQGFISTLFSILILAKVISLIPNPKDIEDN